MDENKQIGDIATRVSAYEILVSVGVPLLVASEELFNKSELVPTEYAIRLSSELYTLSSVLASFAAQDERYLKTRMVDLPQDIGGIRIKNPLFEEESEDLEANASRSSADGMGDLPF
jgi:hypothetical protein